MQASVNAPQLPLHKPHDLLTQFGDLLLMEISNWRWSWRSMLIMGLFAPMFSITAIGIFAKESGPTAALYVLAGNVILSLMFTNMSRMASRYAYMRTVGTLAYYATLPIRRFVLVLASAIAFLLLSLPTVGFTIAYGAYFLGVTLKVHPLLLLVLPLCTLSLASIGALLGTTLRTIDEVQAVTQVLTLVLLALGPVLIPTEKLPPLIQTVGYLSPATYAASALRQVLVGHVGRQIWFDLALLGVFCLVSFWLTAHKMDWRQE